MPLGQSLIALKYLKGSHAETGLDLSYIPAEGRLRNSNHMLQGDRFSQYIRRSLNNYNHPKRECSATEDSSALPPLPP